jgi:hypothetical protein
MSSKVTAEIRALLPEAKRRDHEATGLEAISPKRSASSTAALARSRLTSMRYAAAWRSAWSANRQSALTSRICSTMLQRADIATSSRRRSSGTEPDTPPRSGGAAKQKVHAPGYVQIALRLTRLLRDRGDTVRSLIRNPDHSDDVRDAGGEPVVCDLESAGDDEVAQALGSCDAVVFAAGAGPASGPERKETMDYGGAIKLIRAASARSLRSLDAAPNHQENVMHLTRNTIKTMAGPSEWFTGAVYVDTVATPSDCLAPGREQRPRGFGGRAPRCT